MRGLLSLLFMLLGCIASASAQIAISGANRNTLFVDASLRIKHKRVEYSVEARNVLNNSVFINATNSNSMDYLYSYALRRASVVFKVRFSFK